MRRIFSQAKKELTQLLRDRVERLAPQNISINRLRTRRAAISLTVERRDGKIAAFEVEGISNACVQVR